MIALPGRALNHTSIEYDSGMERSSIVRLWSLHPRYLDPKSLVALWREGLLAQAVLAGQTRGYRHHPQLDRFLQSAAPAHAIAAYLQAVHAEAAGRGYRFDRSKVGPGGACAPLTVARGQLEYEWAHLTAKLQARAPVWLRQFEAVGLPEPHPLFQVIEGPVAAWETMRVLPGTPSTAPGNPPDPRR